MNKQKHLRFSPDQRLLLDTLRQYLGAASETHAGAQGLRTLGEQLVATYLAAGRYPERCLVLVAALNAAVGPEAGPDRPPYCMDGPRRELLRWHAPSDDYRAVPAALSAWLLPP